jgi:ABC-type Fe3+ transport system permease subunit
MKFAVYPLAAALILGAWALAPNSIEPTAASSGWTPIKTAK